MYTEEQITGMQALLERINKANRDAGRIRGARIGLADIVREKWGKRLSHDEALELARQVLNAGDWRVLSRPATYERDLVFPIEFTDLEGYRRLQQHSR